MTIDRAHEWAAARTAIADRDFENAVLHLLRVVDADDEDAEALTWLGACYGQLQEYVEAEYYLSQACELAPDKPQPHYNLGRCYEARQQIEMAIRSYENALRASRQFKQAEEGLQRLHATLSPDLRNDEPTADGSLDHTEETHPPKRR